MPDDTPPPPPSPEAALRERFAVREEPFSHGAFRLSVLLPRAAEELIDETEFNTDERLPYWADLWPSARALSRFLLDAPPPPARTVELGCGVALPSLALLSRGAGVVATDYYDDALLFARANAARNGLPPLATAHVDWRMPPASLGRFGRVVAADVLYEMRNAEALAALLPRIVEPGGEVLLADPGRVYLAEFRMMMFRAGWTVESVEVREEVSVTSEGRELVSKVGILRLTPPGES